MGDPYCWSAWDFQHRIPDRLKYAKEMNCPAPLEFDDLSLLRTLNFGDNWRTREAGSQRVANLYVSMLPRPTVPRLFGAGV